MSVTGRVWHAVTAAVVVVAFVIQIPITAADESGVFDTPAARVANLFTFFTILTNLLVGGTSAAIALRPAHRSRLLAVLRVDAVLGIAVTAAVYHTLLADLYDLRGAEEFANQLFHSVSPALALAGWLLFGPRGLVDRRVVLASLAYPLVWLVFTLVRGALIGWYPYPFVDVDVLGYPQVLLNCLGVTLLFLVLAAALLGLDRLLPGRRERDPATGARIGS
ncbi:Pr6Pr family membrane protein [Pseudonocardia saturnea]